MGRGLHPLLPRDGSTQRPESSFIVPDSFSRSFLSMLAKVLVSWARCLVGGRGLTQCPEEGGTDGRMEGWDGSSAFRGSTQSYQLCGKGVPHRSKSGTPGYNPGGPNALSRTVGLFPGISLQPEGIPASVLPVSSHKGV